MARRSVSIPVEPLKEPFENGLTVVRSAPELFETLLRAGHAHRHDFYFFALHECGASTFEVDFVSFEIEGKAAHYVSPQQVHRLLNLDGVELFTLAIAEENISPEYLTLLEDLPPSRPVRLTDADFELLRTSASFCLTLHQQAKDLLSFHTLQHAANAFIGLVLEQYTFAQPAAMSRFDQVYKAFRRILEKNFLKLKRPADYAESLHLSVPYLNECVRAATGFPVSDHIRNRVILEAKRLLHHSDRSVKLIAGELGYDDPAYFSRLFARATGMTAQTFRAKNLD
jgi:AraC family transcriptional activator of pobA